MKPTDDDWNRLHDQVRERLANLRLKVDLRCDDTSSFMLTPTPWTLNVHLGESVVDPVIASCVWRPDMDAELEPAVFEVTGRHDTKARQAETMDGTLNAIVESVRLALAQEVDIAEDRAHDMRLLWERFRNKNPYSPQ